MSMSFDPESLCSQLARFPVPQRYCVAFSGGCDSHVLLWALASIRQNLKCSVIHAFHINHGLHENADDWAQHCIQVCNDLGISIEISKVKIQVEKGQSLEAQAREARYRALEKLMHPGDMLLLAHHQNDQAETLLLQLLRGAGVNGLAAMPELTVFATGWLARPLLHFKRDQIESFAKQHRLVWIDDPSNLDATFDRNYLRHDVMPLLAERWPSVASTLGRAARHQAEAAALLDELARDDYLSIATQIPNVVTVSKLLHLSPARQSNVIRYWIRRVCGLNPPDAAHLVRILNEVLTAREDKSPMVKWPGTEVRRYRDNLYAEMPVNEHDACWQATWDAKSELALPCGGKLITQEIKGRGVLKEYLSSDITVRYRQGGEVCQLPGRQHHHELKKLFQEWGVPPWFRDRIPLIFAGEQLLQIVGYGSCAPFAVKPDETGVEFVIQD